MTVTDCRLQVAETHLRVAQGKSKCFDSENRSDWVQWHMPAVSGAKEDPEFKASMGNRGIQFQKQ